MRRGIILSGGTGSRLFPITTSVNKQLLPIYDKPLIYYPLSTVMQANVKEILIICSSELSLNLFYKLLGNGKKFGIEISYCIQEEPRGLADAFIVGEKFLDGNEVILALGDNIFHGRELDEFLSKKLHFPWVNIIFGSRVREPSSYGVAIFGEGDKLIGMEEKPKEPKSNWAIPGLYIYDSSVIGRAEGLKPSERGELEITDLSRTYLGNGLKLKKLYDTVWFDAGTHDSLLEAAQYIQAVQRRTGEPIGDPYWVAKKKEWI